MEPETETPLEKGTWVRVERLSHLDPGVVMKFPELCKNRKLTAHGVIVEELAGLKGDIVIVDYREPHGEPCGMKAIHERHELKRTCPLA